MKAGFTPESFSLQTFTLSFGNQVLFFSKNQKFNILYKNKNMVANFLVLKPEIICNNMPKLVFLQAKQTDNRIISRHLDQYRTA